MAFMWLYNLAFSKFDMNPKGGALTMFRIGGKSMYTFEVGLPLW